MSRFRTLVTLLAIGLFGLLPLYEIADYGEHWPNDGNYVSGVLSVLFLVGVALAARRAAASASEQAAAFSASEEAMDSTRPGLVSAQTALEGSSDLAAAHAVWKNRLRRAPALMPTFFAGSTNTPRFVVVHDFRI